MYILSIFQFHYSIFGLEENSRVDESYLTNTTQAVCVGDELSSATPVLIGVPLVAGQYPWLYPVSNIMIYVDDTVIYLLSTFTSDILNFISNLKLSG